ncbi:MAG: tRNA (N(6)-L-threonylcarbamoyladenosine(37)-C(2))-methylthiotransferase MtaB [Candidatus Omnitrophica bacterium]|nr:tRNA (N(6)-L-threonylcarbamoyladenosine(37)-C(2))-methylthiotransferase MtaB [Candidatus Omnitrophota bacterium]MBU4472648.1 tRNA (N(6)-L-threonylcarbamoyladenosine(37)-C(2))-methylthiotransferase MtaB [Candidatus Omnitrophota bacterium]MCG2706729.1 tRNA (N(6)-L-threonylcarbamoyladenosine(37)-C(2))-methylthiotransferase MtaB [Candidatus Omnitrophota bacterium]
MKTINPSTTLRVNGERSRTIKFFTLGCKVNQYETQVIRERFIKAGFRELEDGQPADIYVINTCTVTSTADRKSRRLIHYSHRQNPKAKIIVTGCYTELDSDEIAKISGISHIVKNKEKNGIVGLLDEHNELNEHNEVGIPNAVNQGSRTSGSRRDTEAVTTFGISNFSGHTRVFLKIQDGCNNLCSYCKIPLVRGASKSRPLKEIIREAENLVKNGFKEIVLSGICLGAYGRDLQGQLSLVNVVEALENIEGLLRIRLSSIEAADVSDRLIQKMRQSRKLCRHLHIPIQSGDDAVLKKMKRSYKGRDYLNLINRIKRYMPGVAITTDVMVGFPGEDEINFKNTTDLIKKVLPLRVHIFPYSPREGTPAYNFKDKVNPVKIRERILRLQGIAKACALAYRKGFLTKNTDVLDVLIETQSKENPTLWEGYTDNYIKALVKSNQNLKNQLVSVRLEKITKDFILAEFH